MLEKRTIGAPRRRLQQLRSWIRYGTGLRAKLIVLVLAIACLVIGALYAFSYASMRTLVASIYEQRARSVAALISKAIEEKDYVLYYSPALDVDINRLLDQHESVVGITVIGLTARGFLTIASTDPSAVGILATEAERARYSSLREIEVAPARLHGVARLRAIEPIFSGADLMGIVVVDMSATEQAQAILRLSWQFAAGSLVGFLFLGGFLYLAMRSIVTKPVGQLAEAMGAVARRKYDVEVRHPVPRRPGAATRDEMAQLIDGFNLMTRVLHSHEQELMKLVVLDELTGTYTVDHLRAELERELMKTRRYKHPTSVLVVDVGEVEGRTPEERDSVLIATAGFLVRNLRNVDIVFRVGPFRFAALLPETPAEGAAIAAQRVESRIPDLTVGYPFPVVLALRAMGWAEDGAPGIDDVLADIASPGSA
jgi:diguanylate cyclase (GGDEF)-like protein